MKKKNNSENIIFGKRLHEYRIKAGLSVAEIARDVGVATSTYREWEYGRAITGLYYPKLARALNLDLYELFGIEILDPKKQPLSALTAVKLRKASTLLIEVLADL